MIRRKQLLLHEYKGFGGNKFDSYPLAAAFNDEFPYDFGVMEAQIFSASNYYNNKPLTEFTLASGNYKVIDRSVYEWTLIGDDQYYFYSTLTLSNPDKPGFGLAEFRIALSEGFLEEPDVLMCEDNRFLIEIVGTPVQQGNFWVYRCRLQTSNPLDYVPADVLGMGRRFIKASTSVSDEANTLYGTDQYGSRMRLSSQIGYFAEKVSFSDKAIRRELQAKDPGSTAKSVVRDGMAFAIQATNKKTKEVVKRGMFISYAEGKLLDRLMMDREVSMVYGKQSTRPDFTGRYTKRTGPGFRELVQDGHTMTFAPGNISMRELESFFHAYFLNRVPGENRHIVVDTGEAGYKVIHNLAVTEWKTYLTTANGLVVDTVPGIGGNRGLSYGFQFMELQFLNGIRLTLKHNPMKDDPAYCGISHPDDPNYTLDSFRMDIYDYGSYEGERNMTMLMESYTDEYAFDSGIVHPYKGLENSGGQVPSMKKEITFVRATSGGLLISDTSRVGSIIPTLE